MRHAERGHVRGSRGGPWLDKYLAVGDVSAEDRRRLFAFARDLLNSDYAGHRLTFQLFAQSPAFAHLLAVYNNYDFDGPADLVRRYAGLEHGGARGSAVAAPLTTERPERDAAPRCVARVRDRGAPRRGTEQGELDLVADGAVAIRDGRRSRRLGPTDDVLARVGRCRRADARRDRD